MQKLFKQQLPEKSLINIFSSTTTIICSATTRLNFFFNGDDGEVLHIVVNDDVMTASMALS